MYGVCVCVVHMGVVFECMSSVYVGGTVYLWEMCIWKGVWMCGVYVCVYMEEYRGVCGGVYVWCLYTWSGCAYGRIFCCVECVCVCAKVCVFNESMNQ